MREGFESDEQLSVFDILMKKDLSKADIKKIKELSVELLNTIKLQLEGMDHPFDKPNTKATIIVTIRNILWRDLPESYSEESIPQYRDAVYNFVRQQYEGVA